MCLGVVEVWFWGILAAVSTANVDVGCPPSPRRAMADPDPNPDPNPTPLSTPMLPGCHLVASSV